MGVEFFPCTYCDDTYADCGEYFSCDCGMNYCSTECGDREEDLEDEEEKITCRVCRKEYATEYMLLDFLLKRCNLTPREATALYFESIEKKPKRK